MVNKDFYCYGFFKDYVDAKNANDRDKCVAMEHQCYEQFMDVAHKMKWDLVKRLQKTACSPETVYAMTNNYEKDIYPELIKAMNCVKLDKIPQKKNKKGEYTWNFYAAYWGYLATYNRDVVGHYVKQCKNEILTDFKTECETDGSMIHQDIFASKAAALQMEQLQSKSPENLYEEKLHKDAFWKAVDSCMNNKFNSTQKAIWNLKKDSEVKLSSKDVCKELNITAGTYNREMRSMKETFKSELARYEDIII